MKYKRFYKTQQELAKGINQLIDDYTNNEIKDATFTRYIKEITQNNEDKLLKDNDYTQIIKQRCGKRRLALLNKIITVEGDKNR